MDTVTQAGTGFQFGVRFDECASLDAVWGRLRGEGFITLTPDAIWVNGVLSRNIPGGLHFFHYPLGLGLLLWGLSIPWQGSHKVDPAGSKALYNESMRCMGLRLPNGRWLAIEFDPQEQGGQDLFPVFLEIFRRAYGDRLTIQAVEVLPPGPTPAIVVVMLLMVAAVLGLIVWVLVR